MDIFDGQYFRFHKQIMVGMGIWPYGPTISRRMRKYLWLLILFLVFTPHMISVIVHWSDIDKMMLNAVVWFSAFVIFLKFIAIITAEKKMKVLYENVANNWLAITDEEERKILVEYSEFGRKKALYYFGAYTTNFLLGIPSGLITISTLPLIPIILDIFKPLSDPRARINILEGELFIDRETHYWLYSVLDSISVFITGSVSVSIDGMYIMCVENCCALYAIIKYRLHKWGSKENGSPTKNDPYDDIVGVIKLHQNALKSIETVNEGFSIFFLFLLISNMGAIPVLAVTVISNLDQMYNCIRFSFLFILFALHLFMLFWPGQTVLDHGIEILDDAYYNEWYTTPIRARKMLMIFMLRCSQPPLLTAGGLMVMNFVTFSMIMRTAISYITVVGSFR